MTNDPSVHHTVPSSLNVGPLHDEQTETADGAAVDGDIQREGYRPIAPICLEQDAGRWFGGEVPDPYMLYFSQVESSELRAVTHVDGTARTQTVDRRRTRK